MNNNEKLREYLINNVGFHMDDFSLCRQAELRAMLMNGYSEEWILLALSKDSLENWERIGFGLMSNSDFKNKIDGALAALKTFGANDYDRAIERQQKDKIWVSEKNFRDTYDAVMAQGMLYEYNADPNDHFWAYNPGLTQKGKVWLNTIIAEKKRPESFTQNEKVMFTAACLEVNIRKIVAP